PDGRTLATAGRSPDVQLWDPQTGQVRRRLHGHTAIVFAAAFSPDGGMLATASRDGTLRFWDVATGQQVAALTAPQKPPAEDWFISVAWSRDGRWLAAGTFNNVLMIDAAARQVVRTLTGHRRAVWAVAFTPDSRTLVTGSSDTTVKLWDPLTGAERATLRGHT